MFQDAGAVPATSTKLILKVATLAESAYARINLMGVTQDRLGCDAKTYDSGKRSLAERLNQATKVNANANTTAKVKAFIASMTAAASAALARSTDGFAVTA